MACSIFFYDFLSFILQRQQLDEHLLNCCDTIQTLIREARAETKKIKDLEKIKENLSTGLSVAASQSISTSSSLTVTNSNNLNSGFSIDSNPTDVNSHTTSTKSSSTASVHQQSSTTSAFLVADSTSSASSKSPDSMFVDNFLMWVAETNLGIIISHFTL